MVDIKDAIDINPLEPDHPVREAITMYAIKDKVRTNEVQKNIENIRSVGLEHQMKNAQKINVLLQATNSLTNELNQLATVLNSDILQTVLSIVKNVRENVRSLETENEAHFSSVKRKSKDNFTALDARRDELQELLDTLDNLGIVEKENIMPKTLEDIE